MLRQLESIYQLLGVNARRIWPQRLQKGFETIQFLANIVALSGAGYLKVGKVRMALQGVKTLLRDSIGYQGNHSSLIVTSGHALRLASCCAGYHVCALLLLLLLAAQHWVSRHLAAL